MKLWIEIDENNRLTGYSSTSVERFFEVETDKEPVNVGEWKYSGGQLVYDPDGYVPPEIVPEPSELEIIKQENAELKQRMKLAEAAQLETLDMLFEMQEKIGGEV